LQLQNIEDDGDADSEDNCIVGREEREAYLADRKLKSAEKERDYNRAYSKRPEVVEKRKAKQDAMDPQELAARAERKRVSDRAYRNRPDVIARRQLNAKAKKDAAQQSRLEKGYDTDQGAKKRRERDAIVESASLSQDNHGFDEVS
jgi:hypothetical protein